MKNHERTPAPYLMGTCNNGSVSLAGLNIGTSYMSGSVVCVKTNGGSLVVLQAPNINTGNFINNEESQDDTSDDPTA